MTDTLVSTAVPATDAVSSSTHRVVNPATGELIAEVPAGTAADVDVAVAAAKDAFASWRRTTPAHRAGLLLQVAA